MLAGFSWQLYAQQITGNLRGTVTDPSGAVVQNAGVAAIQAETGLRRTATTRRDGSYLLLELPVGHYRLEVQAQGFRKYLQEGISLNMNETATAPVRLAVGTEKQEVNVREDAQIIQGTVTSLGKAVLSRELLSLPLNGRNFTQLGVLQPGWCRSRPAWRRRAVLCAKARPTRSMGSGRSRTIS